MPRDEKKADLMGAAEALLFVSDEPVSAARLADIMEISPSKADEILCELATEYEEENRGIQLLELAGGWRFYTHPAHHELIEKYVISWDTRKLSQAALEALAVIAYQQPIARSGVNAVRGVNSEGVISSLVEKGLVREVGREKSAGAAILYGTTRTFLEKFGLKSLKDLPALEDFAPDEESRAFIRARLSADKDTDELRFKFDDLDNAQRADIQAQMSVNGSVDRASFAEAAREQDDRADKASEMSAKNAPATTEALGDDVGNFGTDKSEDSSNFDDGGDPNYFDDDIEFIDS